MMTARLFFTLYFVVGVVIAAFWLYLGFRALNLKNKNFKKWLTNNVDTMSEAFSLVILWPLYILMSLIELIANKRR